MSGLKPIEIRGVYEAPVKREESNTRSVVNMSVRDTILTETECEALKNCFSPVVIGYNLTNESPEGEMYAFLSSKSADGLVMKTESQHTRPGSDAIWYSLDYISCKLDYINAAGEIGQISFPVEFANKALALRELNAMKEELSNAAKMFQVKWSDVEKFADAVANEAALFSKIGSKPDFRQFNPNFETILNQLVANNKISLKTKEALLKLYRPYPEISEFISKIDCEILEVDKVTSVIENPEAEGINVFPNPTTGSLTIEMPSLLSGADITIYDLNGSVVASFKVDAGTNSKTWDSSKNAAGEYTIVIAVGDSKVSKKIIKQ